ncbi:MAG: BON domain-containing protein [Desulfobacterales bacterium]|nr:MAG: BON domain-containing protein [Desulfobacterales bacterium]
MKRYFGLGMLAMLSLVTGCTPALIGGGAAGGYAVATDERSVGEMVDDATITSQINTAMAQDPQVHPHRIDVDTLEGDVVLSGVVDTQEEADRALEIARGVQGVKSVKNDLQIGKKSAGQIVDDQILGNKIKAKLIGEPEIRSLNIDVDVNQGVVILTGYVGNRAQKNRVMEIARTTQGTVNVVDNLRIK